MTLNWFLNIWPKLNISEVIHEITEEVLKESQKIEINLRCHCHSNLETQEIDEEKRINLKTNVFTVKLFKMSINIITFNVNNKDK